MAVLGSIALAFLIVLPALFAPDTFVPPVAFFAVTAIGTIGLYIAYVMPVFLRWRMGDAFEPRSWTLGPRYKWINAIAVVFVAVMFVVLMLPTTASECRGRTTSTGASSTTRRWSSGVVLLGAGLAWVLGMNKRYTGPIRQIEFDEGMGIVEEKPVEPEAPPPPAS